MKSLFRLILGIIAGVAGGSVVNLGLVIVGSEIIPAPAGVDVTDPASISAAADLFGPQHFLFPFIAHAGGTLAGCLIASLVAVRQPRIAMLAVGCLSLLGGIVNAFMIPAPAWFLLLDISLAYIPMTLLALLIYRRLKQNARSSQ